VANLSIDEIKNLDRGKIVILANSRSSGEKTNTSKSL